MAKKKKPTRFISRPEVLDKTGLTFQSIWNMMCREEFPRARVANGQSLWVEAEVDAWILSRPVRKYRKVDAA